MRESHTREGEADGERSGAGLLGEQRHHLTDPVLTDAVHLLLGPSGFRHALLYRLDGSAEVTRTEEN